MEHKYSTYVLAALLVIGIITVITSAINSDELDEVCSINDRYMYRSNGTWGCGIISGATGNPFDQSLNTTDSVTFNNVTSGYFCLNVACSKYIYDNGTAVIIQG